MRVTDQEVDRKARRLIAQFGCRAAVIAAERLNHYIDEGDLASRDTWARVVHRIHENQTEPQGRNVR